MQPINQLSCFKAYDIRGRLGSELNPDIAYRIGRAYGQIYQPQRIVVGADMRLSSEELKQAVARGLIDAGVDVIDLGMTGTEEVYFAAFHLDVQGGIEVTASHNPIDFNGMKLVRENAYPINADNGLQEIQQLAQSGDFTATTQRGNITKQSILAEFVQHLIGYINPQQLRPLKIVTNAGNGAAGHVIDAIEQRFKQQQVPIEFIKIQHQPDGTFPNGIPNPLLPKNRAPTSQAILEHKADLGIAWDGDFDRCFLFDEQGNFIEAYYIVGLLAQAFMLQQPKAKIIHDPRLIWNTLDLAQQFDGQAIQCKSGHAFIKQRMRQENAVYGGEMSAHHYFRDFAYCDSGMIPWLLTIELMSRTKQNLSSLVNQRITKFPCSGEINFTVADPQRCIDRVLQHYQAQQPQIDRTDGISLSFEQWRFNLRASNTEPLLRLNIETKGWLADNSIQTYIDQLTALIERA